MKRKKEQQEQEEQALYYMQQRNQNKYPLSQEKEIPKEREIIDQKDIPEQYQNIPHSQNQYDNEYSNKEQTYDKVRPNENNINSDIPPEYQDLYKNEKFPSNRMQQPPLDEIPPEYRELYLREQMREKEEKEEKVEKEEKEEKVEIKEEDDNENNNNNEDNQDNNDSDKEEERKMTKTLKKKGKRKKKEKKSSFDNNEKILIYEPNDNEINNVKNKKEITMEVKNKEITKPSYTLRGAKKTLLSNNLTDENNLKDEIRITNKEKEMIDIIIIKK